MSRDRVVLPAPEPPITAVKVPGRAVNEMFSSSPLPLMLKLTALTSSPPARVATWVWRARVPPVNARSTLPMVTMSPSLRIADPTRIPFTKVPLMLCASRISVPIRVGVENA
ncbi:hypothetical protein DL240490_02854 [Mycobacterium marinum]|nr:hypothetical protein DL240490_02854 [Mycobacterium marinum]